MASKPIKTADTPASDGDDTISSTVEPTAPAATTDAPVVLIPMRHPDGGTCDAYKADASGNVLVPADEAAVMLDHGFVVVPG